MSTLEPELPDPPRVAGAADDVLAEAAAVVDPLPVEQQFNALDVPHRLLLVHAHPDDETIGTGATMAHYAARGAAVTLVTCTLGEEGEVLVPELEHLAAGRDDQLGPHRIEELATACEALGVADHRFLDRPGRWRDSGMMGLATNDRPDVFWRADLDEAVGALVAVIREVRPQVLVTYDENGGYGHPDHIQAHRVAVAAFDAAADPARYPDAGEAWTVSKLYYSVLPLSDVQAMIDRLRDTPQAESFGGPLPERAEDMGIGVPDDQVTATVDATDQLDAKIAAMRAHRTQISVDGPFFALADGVGRQTFGVEHYRLVRGDPGPAGGPRGREDDLFAGVSTSGG